MVSINQNSILCAFYDCNQPAITALFEYSGFRDRSSLSSASLFKTSVDPDLYGVYFYCLYAKINPSCQHLNMQQTTSVTTVSKARLMNNILLNEHTITIYVRINIKVLNVFTLLSIFVTFISLTHYIMFL